jgi:hypothetical protein
MESAIPEQLVRQSVVPMDCTIPPEMTIAQWRRQRASGPRPKGAAPCDHLCDCTTRYDREQRLLTFLLVCPVCRTERVIETQHYEPRFEPGPAPQVGDAPVEATVHRLPVRRDEQPARHAA